MLNLRAVQIEAAQRGGAAKAHITDNTLPIIQGDDGGAVAAGRALPLEQDSLGNRAAVKAKAFQQGAEQPIQFEAEAAPATDNNLLKDILNIQRDLSFEIIDIQILKGNVKQMGTDQNVQRFLFVGGAVGRWGIGKLGMQVLPVVIRVQAKAGQIGTRIGDGAEYTFVHGLNPHLSFAFVVVSSYPFL